MELTCGDEAGRGLRCSVAALDSRVIAYTTFVKVGIVGVGFMGATHVDALTKIKNAELAAVCTRDARASSGDLRHIGGNLNRKLGVYDFSAVRKCADWQELVSDPQLDAVGICLPTDMHASVAVAALSAGKHVFCEKPMALTTADCDRMSAAAEEHNRVLMIGQVLRFWPEYIRLREFVKSGEYGAPLSATLVRRCGMPDWSKWLPDEKRSGGAVLDLLIHDIDQALWIFGPPHRVAAKSLGPMDTLAATLIYKDGPEVRVQGGWFAAASSFSMSFQARAERAELELTPAGLQLSNDLGERKTIQPDEADAYESELAYFVECCRENKKPARCLPEDSARAVKLALLLKQSRSQSGEPLECVL